MAVARKVANTEYRFTAEGEFLDDHDNKFEFNVHKTRSENQARYERIGDAVTQHVYTVLEEDYGLERIPVPPSPASVETETNGEPPVTETGPPPPNCAENAEPTTSSRPDNDKPPPPNHNIEPRSFVFASPGFSTSTADKLVLINGSGAVRAGMWARAIIMNNDLNAGAMFPYITWAQKNNLDVLVLNTNESGGHLVGSGSPVEHAFTVWNQFLEGCTEGSVMIVAHSYGGVVVQRLAREFPNFGRVVRRVALTDGVQWGKIGDGVRVVNWVSSGKPLDTKMGPGIRSAGTPDHSWTSHTARESVWEWLLEEEEEYQEEDQEEEEVDTQEMMGDGQNEPDNNIMNNEGMGEPTQEQSVHILDYVQPMSIQSDQTPKLSYSEMVGGEPVVRFDQGDTVTAESQKMGDSLTADSQKMGDTVTAESQNMGDSLTTESQKMGDTVTDNEGTLSPSEKAPEKRPRREGPKEEL
eukprot:sb/3464428/